MSHPSLSTAAMIQALRDHLEQRVRQSEDYRALVALDEHLAACETAPRSAQEGPETVAERRRHLRLLSFSSEPGGSLEGGLSPL